MSVFYFAIEENDRGFYWLEKAYENKDNTMVWLKIARDFSGVRSDPRFKELLKKMGLD
jgi:hypothetical protein